MTKKKDPKDIKSPGPKRKEVNPQLCEEFASYDCTLEEIATGVGVSLSTLNSRRNEDPEYDLAIARGRARIRTALRKAQLKSAIKDGNPSMLKWMGQQLLGQSDKQDVKHDGGINIVYFDKAHDGL